MARLSNNRIAWQYVSDEGTTYRVAAQKAYTDQGVLGGQAWQGVVAAKPGRIKMRRMTFNSVGHGSRVLPIYETTGARAATALTAGTSININVGTDSYAFVSSGHLIPQSHERLSPVTTQST